jgi:predicted PurR-regulated permease PerM
VAVFNPSSYPAHQSGRARGTAFLAFAAAVALLYFGRIFFITLIIAVILAFILEPFVSFFTRFRLPRGLASFLVCSIALFLLYLVGVGVYMQVSGLIEDLPNYSARINELADRVGAWFESVEKSAQVLVPRRLRDRELPQPPPEAAAAKARRQRQVVAPPAPALPPPVQEVRIRPERPPLVSFLYSYLGSFYSVILMASFVPFLVYFMLSWRDHIRRAYLQLFEGSNRSVAGRSWEGIAEMARAYVVGNFVLGLLLAIASTVFFLIVRLPYPLLIGPVSGFLSLVPYVGFPLAIVPPMLAALPIYNSLSLYLIIGTTVGFFHLLALNLLYPKLVGARVHLNPLVVTIALMFWGALWGAIGLILAIPITAAVKAVCDNVPELQAYGKLLGD